MAKKMFEYPVNNRLAKADSTYGITVIAIMHVLTEYRRIVVYALGLWFFGPSSMRDLVTFLSKLWL